MNPNPFELSNPVSLSANESGDGHEAKPNQVLLCIDAANAIYRAHYGITGQNRPYLKSSKGVPTGALMTVLKMIQSVKEEYEKKGFSCVIVMAQESRGATFRDQAQESYKSDRKETPIEIKQQIQLMNQLCGALGWGFAQKDGYEADDVLASLANPVLHASMGMTGSWKVVIVTSDKDAFQSVRPKDETGCEVEVWNWNLKGAMDSAAVEAKTGVKPVYIADWLALMGDGVDHVVGLDGVGPKTAAKWVNQWGGLQGIWSQWEAFEKKDPKGAAKIKEHEALIKHNVMMTTTVKDLKEEHWHVDQWRDPQRVRWEEAMGYLDEWEMIKTKEWLQAERLKKSLRAGGEGEESGRSKVWKQGR